MWKRINHFFMHFEWRLSLATVIWSLLAPAGSFALPAWAARATGVLSEYAPLSWVVCGFAGVFAYAVIMYIYGTAAGKIVRSRYDANFMRETGGVDPLARVFESKRIYLNDFVLPSNPRVIGKTFVDCEIVGPANIYLERDNTVDDVKPGTVDAVALNGDKRFYNGIGFTGCKFRGCTFHRVTLFFEPHEALRVSGLGWLNWISPMPSAALLTDQEKPSLIEDQSDQSQKGTEEEKQH